MASVVSGIRGNGGRKSGPQILRNAETAAGSYRISPSLTRLPFVVEMKYCRLGRATPEAAGTASVAAVTELLIDTADGVGLEARWDLPASREPTGALVFCHPHPLHGGTMNAPLMDRVSSHLVGAGRAVLRFNFRGVGGSGGGWEGGIGELNDVAAAVALAQKLYDQTELAGWSFGAATALRWQARDRDDSTYVGIAPPVASVPMPGLGDLTPAPRSIIIGERDQVISVDDAREYATAIGATFRVLPATDHFFHFREEQLAELVLEALS